MAVLIEIQIVGGELRLWILSFGVVEELKSAMLCNEDRTDWIMKLVSKKVPYHHQLLSSNDKLDEEKVRFYDDLHSVIADVPMADKLCSSLLAISLQE